MDTTQAITHISLCAGYGGIDLGLRGAIPNLRTVAFSEIEAFASANLVAKMEAGLLDCAPIWTDLKTFPWRAFSDRVDILSGGYPCQPFSAAGKRLGTEDPRHLWPFIADGIRILRPRLCFFENVEGHISLGLREVIGELESMGYAVSWGIFSAREVGAPHQRKRVFILADRDGKRGQLSDWWRESAEQVPFSDGETRRAWPSRPGQPQYAFEPPRVVANSASARQQTQRNESNVQRREGLACESSELGNANSLDRRTSSGGRIDDAEAGSAGEIVGNTTGNGLHRCGADTRAEDISGERGRMQKLAGGGTSMGDSSTDATDGCELANTSSQGCDWRPLQDRTGQWSVSQLPQPYRGKSSGIRNEFERCGESDGNMGNAEGGMPGQSSAGDWREGAGGAGEGGQLANHLRRGLQDTSNKQRYNGTGNHAGIGTRPTESSRRQTEPSLGECFDESSSLLDKTLTLNPYGHNVHEHENLSKKRRAREILFEVWTSASSEAIQWTTGGLQYFLTEKILQSEMQLDGFTQRICYFVWCLQTGHQAQGWGLSGMSVYESCRNSSQGQKPIEQFKRELGYAMCQLSYEIALERRQDSVETTGILHGVRESSERAWVLSEALPEMEEVWRSTLDQEVWEKGCYVEATSIGNRTDELRLLGNGVVPATATLAFQALLTELLNL